jgi:sulfoxide reductase heme-binding subunit YedZ
VYVAALAGVVHFYWQVKADTREPLIYAGVLAALLALRLRARVKPAPARQAAAPRPVRVAT